MIYTTDANGTRSAVVAQWLEHLITYHEIEGLNPGAERKMTGEKEMK